ncbi:hypothetical protein CYMTET_30584, partial [Cymbomonas tetramitiformis]
GYTPCAASTRHCADHLGALDTTKLLQPSSAGVKGDELQWRHVNMIGQELKLVDHRTDVVHARNRELQEHVMLPDLLSARFMQQSACKSKNVHHRTQELLNIVTPALGTIP